MNSQYRSQAEQVGFMKKVEMKQRNVEPLKNYIFAIGASTGGTEALKTVFNALPNNSPPLVVTQHLPEGFSTLFIEKANRNSEIKIKIAKNGEPLRPGYAYIAPSGLHVQLISKRGDIFVQLIHSERMRGNIPSVDVMMTSVAKVMGKQAIGILLTGMGSDGAQGMLAVHKAGGITIVQDEETSVVWGMPKAAIDVGAAQYVLPLQKIPEKMIQCINTRNS